MQKAERKPGSNLKRSIDTWSLSLRPNSSGTALEVIALQFHCRSMDQEFGSDDTTWRKPIPAGTVIAHISLDGF